MGKTLPTALENEPLVDAAFEIRFGDNTVLSDVLPGVLFHELNPKPIITRLPAADIPQPMRMNDPGLKFAPVQCLDWGKYRFLIGNSNLIINCKLPYPKWPTFKQTILETLTKVEKIGVVNSVDRYALKYVNLIEGGSLFDQLQKIQLSINLGGTAIDQNQLSLQVHQNEENIVHIISVVTGAEVQINDNSKTSGIIVDIDSIIDTNKAAFQDFIQSIDGDLEKLRTANKIKFFGSLTEATINTMIPTYE